MVERWIIIPPGRIPKEIEKGLKDRKERIGRRVAPSLVAFAPREGSATAWIHPL